MKRFIVTFLIIVLIFPEITKTDDQFYGMGYGLGYDKDLYQYRNFFVKFYFSEHKSLMFSLYVSKMKTIKSESNEKDYSFDFVDIFVNINPDPDFHILSNYTEKETRIIPSISLINDNNYLLKNDYFSLIYFYGIGLMWYNRSLIISNDIKIIDKNSDDTLVHLIFPSNKSYDKIFANLIGGLNLEFRNITNIHPFVATHMFLTPYNQIATILFGFKF